MKSETLPNAHLYVILSQDDALTEKSQEPAQTRRRIQEEFFKKKSHVSFLYFFFN